MPTFFAKFGIWEEVSFVLKPGVNLNAVVDSFKKFYADYTSLVSSHVEVHRYTSDGSVMLHAESAGYSLDRVQMYLMDSGAGECTARFFAAGSERETTENEYAQVKKFFTERSHELLEVKHWGEPEEEEQGKLIQRVCRHCGARSHRGEANFCWNCGASITAGEAAVSTRAKTPIVSLNMADGKNLRTCTVCQLGFRQGDLLAWCPFCGGAAHRVHLLEYLHVNGKCPSCSHHLEEEDLAHQFERARLRLPRKPQE